MCIYKVFLTSKNPISKILTLNILKGLHYKYFLLAQNNCIEFTECTNIKYVEKNRKVGLNYSWLFKHMKCYSVEPYI